MPLKGLGFIRVGGCSKERWTGILNEVEAVLARSGYNDRTHPYGKRLSGYETIQYIKKIKTLKQVEQLELMTSKPQVGMELGAVLVSIDYTDDTGIPSKIRLEPCCGWDSKWCENGMDAIDLIRDIFTSTGLFKCVYYCCCENQDFITDAESKEIDRTSLNFALLTSPDFRGRVISSAAKLGKENRS